MHQKIKSHHDIDLLTRTMNECISMGLADSSTELTTNCFKEVILFSLFPLQFVFFCFLLNKSFVITIINLPSHMLVPSGLFWGSKQSFGGGV